MNENRIEELLKSYKESMGSSRRPDAKSARSLVPRLAFSGVVLAVAFGAVFLWPRDATAAAEARLGKAIRNARSMEMTFEMETPTGFRPFTKICYQQGRWRYEVLNSTAMRAVHIEADGMYISHYRALNHVTMQPSNGEWATYPEAEIDALDFAKRQTDMGRIGPGRTMKLLPGLDDFTYRLHLERTEGSYEAVIVVDKKTDLPISTEISVAFGASAEPSKYRQSYKFNATYPDSMFKAPVGKPIVDLRSAQPKLATEWNAPLATIEGTDIRDARVTQDGTVWIAVTPIFKPKMVRPHEGQPWINSTEPGDLLLPAEIDAGNGIRYTRGQEIVPSAILGKEKVFTVGGRDVLLIPFVPMGDAKEAPGKVEVHFATRVPHYPGYAPPSQGPSVVAKETAAIVLTKDEGALPNYFPELDLDHYGFRVPMLLATAKAKAFESDEDWLSAARAYEVAAKAYEGFVKYAGHRPLEKAVKCYEKAGMPAEASRASAEAIALKAGKER